MGIGQTNVKLAGGGIGILRPGHGQRPLHVLMRRDLQGYGFSRIPHTGSRWIAALDDEVRLITVKGKAVVKAGGNQIDKILGGSRNISEKLGSEITLGCFK